MNTPNNVMFAVLVSCAMGCADGQGPLPASDAVSGLPVTNTDAWIGRWLGPEGTYLEIIGTNGGYDIVVRDLDTARTFKGKRVDGHLQFERDHVVETLKASDGNGTGMKWLAGKANCLVVRPGEGYCRD